MRMFPKLALLSIIIFSLSCKKENDTPVNQTPIAEAGSSGEITLPDGITLNGSGTDNDGKVMAYLWSEVSGPNAATITNPGSASTSVNGFIQGVYLFQLMVTDDMGATGVDTVSVIVHPAPIDTLTLQPNNNPDEFQVTWYEDGRDATGTGFDDIPLCRWTVYGVPVTIREALKFDLSTIPSSATIISATLSLYSDHHLHNGNFIDANYGADNSFAIRQIVSPWSSSTLSWANQPATTTTNQIIIPSTMNSSLDLNIDVKNMVDAMVHNNNYGFFMQLQNETMYTSRIFASSNNLDAERHPKLVVIYKTN